jgi:thiol:disulfide interchange protein DsbA
MLLNRRHFNGYLLTALGCALGVSTFTPVFANLVEGRDWRLIDPPQPSDTPGKIEVLEFFSYGCPHCRDLNVFINPWSHGLSAEVSFRRVPVSFGRSAWASLAQLYFALESTGDLERLDQSVFDALHKERVKLYTKTALLDWVVSHGVDSKTFSDAFDSFDVQTKRSRGDYLAGRYQIDAVPTITVAGRYAVLGREVKGLPDLLTIADELIVKVTADGVIS